MDPIINSLLDTDWYKYSMGQVVFRQFPSVNVRYEFINRGKTPFPPGFQEELRRQIEHLSTVRMRPEEHEWLKTCSRYMKRTYIDWLRNYTFDPREVTIGQENGALSVIVEGAWYRTILWEVPLLAIISELYYTMTDRGRPAHSHNWEEKLREKASALNEAGCQCVDFGSRRRHSFHVHDRVVEMLSRQDCFRGTSNPLLAMRYRQTPVGTYAHEGPMAMQALYGFVNCNKAWMDAWVAEFQGDLGIALPDTVTSDAFLRQFGLQYAKLFDGMRQDSGDPYVIGAKYINHYKCLHIGPRTKRLIFSDSLNVPKFIKIHQHFSEEINVTGGIGTNLTNDVGYPPLNIVMKLTGADFGQGMKNVVKLSDEPTKATGDPKAIAYACYALGVEHGS